MGPIQAVASATGVDNRLLIAASLPGRLRGQLIRLDRNGQFSIVAGRGNYSARVLAAGFSPLVPIALSRSQTAELSVITPIDLVVLGLACLAILAVVLAVGRGRQQLLRMIQTLSRRAGSVV